MKRIKYRAATHKAESGQRPRWLIPATLVGLAILMVGGALFLLSRPEPFVPEVTGSSRGVVSQDRFDYGTVPLGSWIQTDFKIKNVGDQPLNILNNPYIEVLEGCCPPDMTISSTRLNPGEEATVSTRFMMHGDMGGKHDFLAHVLTDDPTEPDKQVHILSNWVG
jgi:hypothetical protein